MLERVRERRGVAGEEGGDGIGERGAAADGRQPVEFDREGEHQHDAEPVDRHRYAELREQHRQHVREPATADGGDDAEADADDQRDQHRGDGEFQGGAKAVQDQPRHRLAFEDGAAESPCSSPNK